MPNTKSFDDNMKNISKTPESDTPESRDGVSVSDDYFKKIQTLFQQEKYYEVLGLKNSANKANVRKSYRALSLLVHPDKNPAQRELAENIFKIISEAQFLIMDPEQQQKIAAKNFKETTMYKAAYQAWQKQEDEDIDAYIKEMKKDEEHYKQVAAARELGEKIALKETAEEQIEVLKSEENLSALLADFEAIIALNHFCYGETTFYLANTLGGIDETLKKFPTDGNKKNPNDKYFHLRRFLDTTSSCEAKLEFMRRLDRGTLQKMFDFTGSSENPQGDGFDISFIYESGDVFFSMELYADGLENFRKKLVSDNQQNVTRDDVAKFLFSQFDITYMAKIMSKWGYEKGDKMIKICLFALEQIDQEKIMQLKSNPTVLSEFVWVVEFTHQDKEIPDDLYNKFRSNLLKKLQLNDNDLLQIMNYRNSLNDNYCHKGRFIISMLKPEFIHLAEKMTHELSAALAVGEFPSQQAKEVSKIFRLVGDNVKAEEYQVQASKLKQSATDAQMRQSFFAGAKSSPTPTGEESKQDHNTARNSRK